MTLPTFWRQAGFSVAEGAELLGMPEANLRAWLARCPLPDRLGRKTAARLWLSASDFFFYMLVRDLTALGVGVRTAMLMASSHVPTDSMPDRAFLVVRRDGANTELESTDEPVVGDRAAAVIPIRRLAADLVERAAVIHAGEAK